MKTTISKKSENKLKCICGICNHKFGDKKCVYYQITDSLNPDEKMFISSVSPAAARASATTAPCWSCSCQCREKMRKPRYNCRAGEPYFR